MKNKVAIVTGTGYGIGFSIAINLAKEGVKVVVDCHKNAEGTKRVIKEIEKPGQKAIAFKADVSKSDKVNRMVKITLATFGRINYFGE